MDYYQLMFLNIIENNLDFEHIELLPDQSRFLQNDKLNHAVFERIRLEMTEHFHALFKNEEKIKVIFCVEYKHPYKCLNLRKYFSKYEAFKFSIQNNDLSNECHQYEYVIQKRHLKLTKLIKDISYQDFRYESQTYRKASILTVLTNMDEDIFYYPYDDRGAVKLEL
ncbi:hypothetical protein ACMGE9_09940 [Macrococcus sp. EM39E]|uniref:DUF3885 domain-containing protein n=1 Tax=Macrococcus animalis TaxID=3395467 RepID=UPI0039BEA9EE